MSSKLNSDLCSRKRFEWY